MFLRKLLKKYFVKHNLYELKKNVRGYGVCFAPHNFSERPPIARKNGFNQVAAMCPYLTWIAFLAEKSLTTFTMRSKKGFLLLGKSEPLAACSDFVFTFCEDDKKFIPQALCLGRFMPCKSHRKRKRRIICPPKRNLNPKEA